MRPRAGPTLIESRHGRRRLLRPLPPHGRRPHYESAGSTPPVAFDVVRLPYSLRILLENVLRTGLGRRRGGRRWVAADEPSPEISFRPARVLLQDFTGVPAVVDLAAMRDAMGGSAATRRRSTRWCRPNS